MERTKPYWDWDSLISKMGTEMEVKSLLMIQSSDGVPGPIHTLPRGGSSKMKETYKQSNTKKHKVDL